VVNFQTMSDTGHEFGITGNASHAIADCLNKSTPLYVEATLDDDLSCTTTIEPSTLRKALGVANMRQANVCAMHIESHNASPGPVGVVVKQGDGSPLPVTHRACFAKTNPDNTTSVIAVHHVAKPQVLSTSQIAHFKEGIEGSPFTHPKNHAAEVASNNLKNCAFYPGNDTELTRETAFKGTIEASDAGKTLVAVPIKEKPHPTNDGTLMHVVSRALGSSASPNPKKLSNSGAVCHLPDPTAEGQKMQCFVDSREAMDAMYSRLKEKVDPEGVLKHGIRIQHSALSTSCKPGDKVWSQINLVRHVPDEHEDHALLTRAQVADGTPIPMAESAEPGALSKSSVWQEQCAAAMFGKNTTSSATVALKTAGDGADAISGATSEEASGAPTNA
jgi:hypothetical protein